MKIKIFTNAKILKSKNTESIFFMRAVFNHTVFCFFQFLQTILPLVCWQPAATLFSWQMQKLTFYLVCFNSIYRLLSIPMDNSFKDNSVSFFLHFFLLCLVLGDRNQAAPGKAQKGRQSPILTERQHLVLIKYNMPTQVTIVIFLFFLQHFLYSSFPPLHRQLKHLQKLSNARRRFLGVEGTIMPDQTIFLTNYIERLQSVPQTI